MKAIIFDIDGVVIRSESRKSEIIKKALQKVNLYNIPWVKDILKLGINRILVLDRIYELVKFDKKAVLKNINDECAILESNSIENEKVVNFIKSNKKYNLYTNTSLPIAGLNRVMNWLWIKDYFQELLAFENWSKIENINYVIKKYNIKPEDILFIDDNINHINNVKESWVNTLYFSDYNIDIEEYINTLNN